MHADDDEREKHIVIAEEELLELPLPTYSCEFCGLTVKTRANLRAHHVKTHKILKNESDVAFYTKQRCPVTYIYHCPVVPCRHNLGCGAGFTTSSRLKQHYQNVHMQKCYKCDKCGCFFSTPSNHAYHMRFCGKVFSCSVCCRRYSFKKHLDQHFRRSGHQPIDKPVRRVRRTLKQSTHHQSHIEMKHNELPKLMPSVTSFTTRLGFVSSIGDPTTVIASSTPIQPSPIILPVIILPIPLYCVDESSQLGRTLSSSDQSYLSDNLLLTQYGCFPSLDSTGASSAECITTQKSDEVVRFEHSRIATPEPDVPIEAAHYDFACQFDNTFPSLETGTQTETILLNQDLAPPETSCVSVNTCTDEDNISAFIGSLFCDASVETSYPYPNLVHEFTDTELDELTATGNLSSPIQYIVGNDVLDMPEDYVPTSKDDEVEHCPDNSCINALSFDGITHSSIENAALHQNVHAEVQTDSKSISHVAAATHDTPVHWNATPNRLDSLETPPPLFGLSLPVSSTTGSELNPHATFPLASSSVQQHAQTLSPFVSTLGLPSQSLDSSHIPSQEYSEFGESYRPYDFSSGLNRDTLSSHSIGLQSSPWPPTNAYSSSASQTLIDDWELWLSSVHTQTNTSPLSLTNMSVNGNDEFLTESFGSPTNMNNITSIFNLF